MSQADRQIQPALKTPAERLRPRREVDGSGSVPVRVSRSTGTLPVFLNHGRDVHAPEAPDGVVPNGKTTQMPGAGFCLAGGRPVAYDGRRQESMFVSSGVRPQGIDAARFSLLFHTEMHA